MFKNYLLVAFRNLIRHKVFVIVNIVGLGLGIACCLMIYLFVSDELSYDQFHSKKDSVYKVIYKTSTGNDLGQIPPPIALEMPAYFPEVETTARMFGRNASITILQRGSEDLIIEESNIYFADSSIKEIFTFNFLLGNAEEVLETPYSAIISNEAALRYFGESWKENALGETILMQGNIPFKVAGVFKEFPNNSHIHCNIIAPYLDMFTLEGEQRGTTLKNAMARNWVISHSHTYALLKENTQPEQVNDRFADFFKERAPENMQIGQNFWLQPLLDVHLTPNISLQPDNLGNLQFVYVFAAIAFITLLIACFNFINLSTAQSIKRAKEVGMRKALGAYKLHLFAQFLGESLLICFFGFLLALLLVAAGLSEFNSLTQKELSLALLLEKETLIAFISIFLLTGFLGGCYPAFAMSQVKTLISLKGKVSEKVSKGLSFRKILVIFQFAISAALITGALVIFKQLNFMVNQPMDYKTEAFINVPLFSENLHNILGGVNGEMRSRLTTFEEDIASNPKVQASTLSSTAPGLGIVGRMTLYEGMESEERVIAYNLSIDYDFIKTFGFEIVAGRDFDRVAGSDHLSSFIINETAVSEYNWGTPQEALGKEIDVEGKKGNVIGVIKDFNYSSMRDPLNALILQVHVPTFRVFSIQLATDNLSETLAFLEDKWQEHFPEKTFDYTFMDDALESRYNNEQRLGKIIGIFAALAIIVSCLGAYGLIMFSAKQREKEIGVRKVLGASFGKIILLLFREFTWLYLVGLLIAFPLAYYVTDNWLEDFNYRVTVSPIQYVVGGVITLLIIWLTISYQSIKSALINPITCLKDD